MNGIGDFKSPVEHGEDVIDELFRRGKLVLCGKDEKGADFVIVVGVLQGCEYGGEFDRIKADGMGGRGGDKVVENSIEKASEERTGLVSWKNQRVPGGRLVGIVVWFWWHLRRECGIWRSSRRGRSSSLKNGCKCSYLVLGWI